MITTRDTSTYRTLQYNLSKTSTALNQLYLKSSTGVNVAKASDNPAVVGSIVSEYSTIIKSDRYIENCKNVQDNLSSTEIFIDSTEELMARAKEIAVAAANDSLSQSDRDTYVNEVTQLQESLLDLANTQVDGKYIFAGYNDQIQPFSGTPVTYNGTSDQQMIEVGHGGVTVARNVTGDDLFMSPVDLFAVLDDLAAALSGGDTTVISNQLTPLEEAADQVRTQQSLIGNNSARMDDLIAMHESSLLLVQDSLSRHQDADLTEVLSEISKMELSLEATMQVTSRISSLNLMDYL